MNFFKQKVVGYFSKDPPSKELQPQPVQQPVKLELRYSHTNSSDVFEVLEDIPQYQQIVHQQEGPKIEHQPSRYYVIENEYFDDIVVQRDEVGRILTNEEWQSIIETHSYKNICRKNLIFSILKGIPFEVRKELWEVLAETELMKKKIGKSYSQLLNAPNCKSLDLIKKDVHRTQSCQKFHQELENVLVAYSNLDPCGYTQGMNLIVGSLLELLCIENDRLIQRLKFEVIEIEFEERVFWVFVGIMYGKDWRECFENMKGVMRMLRILEELMEKFVPNVLRHIKQNELDLNMCFSQYYLTLVIYNTPRGLAKRILDLFLLQGERAIHSVILRMMKICEQRILGIQDMGQLIQFFKKPMLEECYEQIKQQKSAACSLEDFALNFFNLSTE